VLIGLAIALDPIPLTTFMVVLPSKRGVRKGAAFVLGWLVSLAIVVSAAVLAISNNPPRPHTARSNTALVVRIVIGIVLVAAAIRQWRRMRRPKKPKKPPKWQEHLDHMSVWFAMGLALEIYAGFRPAQSQAFLVRFRTWMDSHTDQVIIVGSLLLGFWLIAKSIYLIIS
jgi:threonine/homoserine/homoserine lactone efflux protein